MRYVGSKRRIAKEILQIILKNRKSDKQLYLEPFAGGMNSIQHVTGNRIANDINKYVIALFNELVYNEIDLPDKLSPEEYNFVKQNQSLFSDSYIAFVGFCCSFGAKFFGGYARGENRNHCLEAKKHLIKQKNLLKGVEFTNKDYKEFSDLKEPSIIYCDPPYQNTLQYKDSIDYTEFWEWCRKMSKLGHEVFISEYIAPDDFECLWSKNVYNTLDLKTSAKTGTEKLFKYKGVSNV